MLQVSNLTKYYGDTCILRDVSFTLNIGERVGLVGPNGCGKSTLLRIIMELEKPDQGSIRLGGSETTIGYLEQGLRFDPEDTLNAILRPNHGQLALLEQRIEDLAGRMDTAQGSDLESIMDSYAKTLDHLEYASKHQIAEHIIYDVLKGLGLDDLDLDMKIAHLSGGQKTRISIARLLTQQPKLLLLDEPTNHLDLDALEWLEQWLQRFEGGALIVSHDRAFLDNTVTTIFELDPGTHHLTVYPGTYDDYLTAKQRDYDNQVQAFQEQQERIARLSGEARRLSGYANSIEAGTINFATRKIAKGIARRAVVQRRRIERELDQETLEKPGLTWHMKLEFSDTPESSREVLVLDHLTVGYDVPLIEDIEEIVQYGERIALVGGNGTGKTTLMKVLTGRLAPLAGQYRLGTRVKAGYFAQEQEQLPDDGTPFSVLRETATMSDTEVRSFLHYFLFAGDEVFTPVRNLSYGERGRLALAKLVAGGCNLLLLDEPINHLDIPSQTSFEHAIAAFEGTVIAVVHDRYFIKQFATRLLAVEEGKLQRYQDLNAYLRYRKRKLEAAL